MKIYSELAQWWRAEWLQMLTDAGFDARCAPFDHSEIPAGTYEMFVCRRPR